MPLTIKTVEHNSNPWANSTIEQRLVDSGAYDLREYRRIIDLGNGCSRVEPMYTDGRQPRYGDSEEA
ncbi:hypothetical protein FKN04_24535 [Bacillus glycinifermentans]|uniref:hypothetical protein n=1 Tax=Bacillus glycinifermentans TaxID=1664069 RepID=UPI001583BC63|nr:hypothetical protein [Bacillus glycinifermentans]NUJ19697.1 hypothetical protein [Bacillus glycinifermentans]